METVDLVARLETEGYVVNLKIENYKKPYAKYKEDHYYGYANIEKKFLLE